jgi:two-component system, NtrC family, sensor histidine kinase HydH
VTDDLKTRKWALFRMARWFRPQDFAWLLFVAVLIAFTPETNYDASILLVLIGLFQIVESRMRVFSSPRGQIVSVTLKLLFSYLLIGYTHTIFSPYYPIFLLPVVSAATTFELGGVLLVTALACLGYFSFLLPIFIDWSTYELPPEHLSLMSLRASFYAVFAFLVFEQAKAKREEMNRTEEAAAQLAESNRSLRRAEASLRRSERLAALGQLTAGLAHELRNPLGTIRASAEMLTKQSAQARPEIMSEMAGFIRSEVDRMNGLITSFLNFARPLQIHPVAADLKPVIDDVVREANGPAEKAGITLKVEALPVDLFFTFDPDLLRLALSNLLSNAIQASTGGSSVKIRTLSENSHVKIDVEDNGKGIERQHLESIFNPFFTTKPQGVGLGLAIVSKIVDEHGGRISVKSEVGVGTTFEMILPREQHV